MNGDDHDHLHEHAPGDRAQALRQALNEASGPQYWRSLEELSETPEFLDQLHREFPVDASVWEDETSRRSFLKLMGASLALAGLTGAAGCVRQPDEDIVPYVLPPEQVIPGKPLFFATSMTLGGFATGLLAESQMGRPIKLEGNRLHPASLGATDVFAQASILGLYDPDRSRVVMNAGAVSTFSAFQLSLDRQMQRFAETKGKGVRLLTETVTSPLLAAQIKALLQRLPEAKWHQYEPVNRDNVRAGTTMAFGRYLNPVYHFDKAERVVSLDANFLFEEPGSVRYAREFINARRLRAQADAQGKLRLQRELAAKNPAETAPAPDGSFKMNRLYAIESTPTITGAMADNRLSLRPSQVEPLARALAAALGAKVSDQGGSDLAPVHQRWVEALAKDLKGVAGRSIVIAGWQQSPAVHALAHAMNVALGNAGTTVTYTEPVEANPVDQLQSLTELTQEMNAGNVEALFMFGGNPAFTAPASMKFAEAMEKVPFRVHQSLYYDETSFRSHWHLPDTHYLEMWGDARAFDGTVSFIQPLISPLYGARSVHEVFGLLNGALDPKGYDLLRDYWKQNKLGEGEANFEQAWQQAVHDGMIAGSALPAVEAALQANLQVKSSRPAEASGLELVLRPDPSIWDGRFANNGWLQELPKPLTKITWDNVATLSPATARRMGLKNESVVELKLPQSQAIRLPVWVLQGQPDDTVTVHVGYGRQRAGHVGGTVNSPRGGNGYELRLDGAWNASGLELTGTGDSYRLAVTQPHQMMEGRDLIRVLPVEKFEKDIAGAKQRVFHLSLYPNTEWKYGIDGQPQRYPHQHAWGMSIDNNACISCNACVIACQAENNIPVVGKEQVIFNREMHWLRIDTYWTGDADNPDGPYFEPMLCQHCEAAPCEVVCPVAATTHSAEGLNEMTYNRCVGTRYCSNNCPYKVRRFNFLQYQDKTTPVLKLLRNPDVTVRERGVMEKCTYCVQRINFNRIELKKLRAEAGTEDLPPETQKRMDELMGDLQTACQQSCPTEAIIFGDLNYRYADGKPMQVTQLKQQEQNYGVLTELNTQPRTTYLPRFTNPNADLPRKQRQEGPAQGQQPPAPDKA